jgi:hypothetical protein
MTAREAENWILKQVQDDDGAYRTGGGPCFSLSRASSLSM